MVCLSEAEFKLIKQLEQYCKVDSEGVRRLLAKLFDHLIKHDVVRCVLCYTLAEVVAGVFELS